MKKGIIVLLFILSNIAGMSYSQELVGTKITIKDAWDNVFRSVDQGRNYELIGTYQGWNKDAIYIAGYNYQNNPSYYSTKYVSFGGSGVERMWVDLLSGNVGVGTTTPLAKFHVASDGYSLFGPNSTWGALLRVGGNGNVTNDASVVATNGNLHLDGAIGDYGTYLNYYHGSAGILFGNGAQSIIGTISGSGNLAMNGTGTFGTNTVINGHGSSFFNGGNVGIGTPDPQTKLHILVNGILGKNIGDFTPLSRFQGNAFNNSILINDFILRESSGDNWLSVSYIRGLSIDDSFHNPQTLRSWIKQNPYLERIDVGSSGSTFMSVGSNVGIGTTNPDEKLTVNGVIHAREVKVDLSGPLADFVFKPNYKLMSLPQVEQFVKANNHLPQMPSAEEVSKNGLSMGEMQNKLLQKVEELTLYTIQQNKKIESLMKRIDELEAK